VSEPEPHSKEDLLRALAKLEAGDLKFWLGIPPERFATPFGESWSPADTVRHLIKSTTPVTRALRLPRMVLWALFGQGTGVSTRYPDLVARYRAVLAGGARATGRYVPSQQRSPDDLGAYQQALVSRCQSGVETLTRTLEAWDDVDLDRCRLPHPMLGKLTVREMMFFTLYHYEHHRAGVAKRLADAVRS
jgi:hypothetical protein